MLKFIKSTSKISVLIIFLLILSNLYFVAMYLRIKPLYNWHHLRYHELKKLVEYREKYPKGTSISTVVENEKDYRKDHTWCEGDLNKLCVEPKISDWDYVHYCGFTFYFENNSLDVIQTNSPCH